VHHIDNNTLNNNIRNLKLFENINKHSAFHYAARKKDNQNRFMAGVMLDGD
jgi:hypothetical protein